jgi:hypothetical protein
MLKDLIDLAKFRYGRVVMVPYWVGQTRSQGMFPKKTLSRPCSEYEVDGSRNFGHGAPDISRAHIVSFIGSFVEGVLHPFICNATFLQALYFPSVFMVRTLSVICKERKRGMQCHLKLEHIEYHMHWKLKDTAMHSPIKQDIFIHFYFKGPSFLWRSVSLLSKP